MRLNGKNVPIQFANKKNVNSPFNTKKYVAFFPWWFQHFFHFPRLFWKNIRRSLSWFLKSEKKKWNCLQFKSPTLQNYDLLGIFWPGFGSGSETLVVCDVIYICRTIHLNVITGQCHICQRKFRQNSSLTRHIKVGHFSECVLWF